ncbi:MAG: hypothetical protein Q8J68_14565 [Methanolobus sp.]|uniref:hypothetical protein n=1 Tax=Methanolobus sp. TaxID=1874737 RepID=UPI00273127EE|nr:hypothetical protein [Methanolobus sp.]MDP2218497.1 hypothetical protein [Methanolobus sp.]
MMIIGIDPGQDGGIAFIGSKVTAYKMPGTERDIYDLLAEWPAGEATLSTIAFVFLEKVHTMKGQGIASSGKFMQGYGFLRGVVTALRYPLHDVTPQRWQRALGCLTGGNKNISKQKAQQLFPHLKITHNVADALLIVYYGKLFIEGNIKKEG